MTMMILLEKLLEDMSKEEKVEILYTINKCYFDLSNAIGLLEKSLKEIHFIFTKYLMVDPLCFDVEEEYRKYAKSRK